MVDTPPIVAKTTTGLEWVTNATEMINDLLENSPPEVCQKIPTDGVIIINNHIALHGRTPFRDTERHLLRLRFHEPSDYGN